MCGRCRTADTNSACFGPLSSRCSLSRAAGARPSIAPFGRLPCSKVIHGYTQLLCSLRRSVISLRSPLGLGNPRDIFGWVVDFAFDPFTYAQWREKQLWQSDVGASTQSTCAHATSTRLTIWKNLGETRWLHHSEI